MTIFEVIHHTADAVHQADDDSQTILGLYGRNPGDRRNVRNTAYSSFARRRARTRRSMS